MASIFIDNLKGEAPAVEPTLLPNSNAQVARNVRLTSGRIDPLRQNLFDWSPTKIGEIKSIYRFAADTATPYWFHWLDEVDVVRSPVNGDVSERTYFAGAGFPPQVTDNSIAVQGGDLYPMNAYILGVPAPALAPSAVSVPNADQALNETSTYVYTYVSAMGEEGVPSPASSLVDLNTEALSVGLSNMSGAPTGNYNIVAKRIYRAASSLSGAEFQFVAEIPVGQAAYADTTSTDALGEIMVSNDYDMPPATMRGLVGMPNGIVAGFDGNDLLFSEPYQPHAFPIPYRLSTDYPIVGIAAFGSSIAVLTTNVPYIVTGVHPSGMSMDKLELNQSCVAKRGVVDMGAFIVYPSPDGLVSIGSGPAGVITRKLVTRDEWQALNPSSMHAYSIDGMYICFYDNGVTKGGFILDPFNPDVGLVFIDQYATAGFTDSLSDALYLVDSVSGGIVEWNAIGQPALSGTWRSKKYIGSPVSYSSMKINALNYPVTVNIFADGLLKHAQQVQSSGVFRLPGGFLAELWEIEVSGINAIRSIQMATSVAELKR